MKVYIVTSGSYSAYHIDAVCLNKEEAEEIARRISEGDVEEYETATIIRDDRKLFMVSYYISSGNYYVYHCKGSVDEIIYPGDADIRDYTQNQSERYAKYCMYIRAKDEEHAKKIFQDKFAEYKAKKEGLV